MLLSVKAPVESVNAYQHTIARGTTVKMTTHSMNGEAIHESFFILSPPSFKLYVARVVASVFLHYVYIFGDDSHADLLAFFLSDG